MPLRENRGNNFSVFVKPVWKKNRFGKTGLETGFLNRFLEPVFSQKGCLHRAALRLDIICYFLAKAASKTDKN